MYVIIVYYIRERKKMSAKIYPSLYNFYVGHHYDNIGNYCIGKILIRYIGFVISFVSRFTVHKMCGIIEYKLFVYFWYSLVSCQGY